MSNLKMFILTHKPFKNVIPSNEEIYTTVLNGAELKENTYGYTPDNTGDNISRLNEYYAELTGEYWAWKNCNYTHIGFCHYRRYFAKGLNLKILTEKDILKLLKDYDVILPMKFKTKMQISEELKEESKTNEKPRLEEYFKIKEIIKKEFSDYLKSYEKILNGDYYYPYNMFICSKEIADDYFNWIFAILAEMHEKIDYSTYSKDNKRLLGYFSEILLAVFFEKNDYKIKECPLLFSSRRFPFLQTLNRKFPFIARIEEKIAKRVKK